jgi:signal transduction histidine kinase
MGKVLLVGNEPNVCRTLAELLRRERYTVLTALDFDGAISLIESTRLDAIVVDIALPDKSGIALLKEVSSRASFIPIIVITKKPRVSQLREVMQAGASDFIVHPVTKDALIRTIVRAIEKKRFVDERRSHDGVIHRQAEPLDILTAHKKAAPALERRQEEDLCQSRGQFAHNEKIVALGRMAAQVAHEVKNPLAGLQLYSLHLKSKLTGKVSASEIALVDKIIDGISQLADTTDRVLNFARTISLSRQQVDLNRIVVDSLALLEPQLKEKRIAVDLRLAEPGAYALLDEASMRSTLINLMLNAIQAMADDGQMTLSTSAGEGALRLAITDTGCGMTDEQVRNLFEPFYTTKSQGLGLGMSFASRVIQLHGGEIAVESRVNVGTSIKIELPVEGEKANAASC